MKNLDHLTKKAETNRSRYDQSPLPNYPNFEPVEKGIKGDKAQNVQVGGIGWGVKKPELFQKQSRFYMENRTDRFHIQHWDKTDRQKFIDLTGSFTSSQDKQLDINPEIYHLMNASAQRISIKSLDMQRQSMQRSIAADGKLSSSPFKSTMSTKTGHNLPDSIISGSKKSFPEVVSFLSNPFQKNNLNYAVKNSQAIVTPKMACGMRFSRAYNPSQRSKMSGGGRSSKSNF